MLIFLKSLIFSSSIAQVSDNLLISLCEWHKIYFFVAEHRTEATPRKCVRQPTSQFCSICKSSAYRKLYCVKPSFSFASFFIRQRASSRQQTAPYTDNTSSHNRDLFGLKHVLQFAWIWIRNLALSLMDTPQMWRRFGWPAFLVSESLAALEQKLSKILTLLFVWVVLCFPHEKMRKRIKLRKVFW